MDWCDYNYHQSINTSRNTQTR